MVEKILAAIRAIKDTFRVSHVRVHEPRNGFVFSNPSEGCASRVVARVSSGNASLSFGHYITQADMDCRFERIMSAKI